MITDYNRLLCLSEQTMFIYYNMIFNFWGDTNKSVGKYSGQTEKEGNSNGFGLLSSLDDLNVEKNKSSAIDYLFFLRKS